MPQRPVRANARAGSARSTVLTEGERSVSSWMLAVVVGGAGFVAAASSPSIALGESERTGAVVGPSASSSSDGSSPLPRLDDARVHLPPGSDVTPIPSEEIFPPQSIPLRFDHEVHVKELGVACVQCHTTATTSVRSSDRLLPAPSAGCDGCHDVSHAKLDDVRSGSDPSGRCELCHTGEGAGVRGKVAPVVIPSPNLKFSHKAHADRNIGCAHCHGRVEEIGLATRDQLPRMAGCFGCHDAAGEAQGDASRACTTCHVGGADGRLDTSFSTGELLPPAWLGGAAHTANWVARHAPIAARESSLCASCHKEEECVDCHDGRVRPRDVHPNDWLSMHATAARFDNPRCTSCHALTTFCGDCHRRVGVARDSPFATRPSSARFHPPPEIWTSAPRKNGHHAWEAQRNLNACVSCHSERDCVTCHAARGLAGGAGINPHPPGFRMSCRNALERNPRPCLVCHGDLRSGPAAECR